MVDDELRLGPSQREVVRVLDEADDWVHRKHILENADRMTNQAVGRVLDTLKERDIVVSKESDKRPDWHVYALARDLE